MSEQDKRFYLRSEAVRDMTIEYIKSLKADERAPYEVLVTPLRGRRSNRQNSYYWGVVIDTVKEYFAWHHGEIYSAQQWHEYFKTRYDQPAMHRIRGQYIKEHHSTSTMTAAEFAAYVELICMEAAQHGCIIPGPEQYGL
jgi:hypothetical protein